MMSADQFHKLELQKRKIIFAASLTEFASYPYDLASTNRIVETAGISKGALFKYFGDKETLYLFVAKQVADEIFACYQNDLNSMPTTFFDSLIWFAKKELEFYSIHPMHYSFLQLLKTNTNLVYQKAISIYQEYVQPVYAMVFSRFDPTELQDGVQQEQAIQYISWILEGYKKTYHPLIARGIEPHDVADLVKQIECELRVYFSWIKKGIFR